MSTNKFQYWPSDGQLGSTKFTMPTNIEDWPSGDTLVGNFVYNEGKLVDFIDTKALIVNESKTTTINYDYVNIELPFAEDAMTINRGPRNKYLIIKFNNEEVEEGGNVIVTLRYKGCKTVDDVKAVDPNYLTNDIVDGVWSEGLGDLEDSSYMFVNCSTLTSFSSDLSSLAEGESMFEECTTLTSFSSDLPSLTSGWNMFYNCTNLISFTSELLSLTNGSNMFRYCSNLMSFTSNLSTLINGFGMFDGCENLATFSSELSSLESGDNMFSYCSNLTSFASDLRSLTNGYGMFSYCSNLTSFASDLRSLRSGSRMFYNCKLAASSVKNIIDTINTYSGKLTLGMGCKNTTSDKDLFAQEVGYDDMTSLIAALQDKGWTVEAQYNGRPTTTYGLRRTVEDTLPVFVKLEELEETEKYADYASEDGSKKFRLDWFHETTGSTEGYTLFDSLEDAMAYWNVFPKENIISTEE